MFEKKDPLLDELLMWRRLCAHGEARQLELLAAFAERDRDGLDPDGEFTHREVAAVVRVTERFASGWIALAETLTTRLPRTLAALRAGAIDVYRARRVAEATAVLDDEQAGAVEAELGDRFGGWSPRQLTYHLRRAVDRVDPAAAAARAEIKRQARCVDHVGLADGAGLLRFQGDVERTQLAYDRVRTIARDLKTAGDTRTVDQIAADVALDCLAGKEFQHAKIQVLLTLPAVTVLGVEDKPGYLAGYGSIPAQRALEMAVRDDAVWQRILTDPTTGRVVDVGRNKYRPTAALRDHVKVAYPTCTAPGCRRPAHTCDLDHAIPFPRGGTELGNLHPSCRTHHRGKTYYGWNVTTVADGTVIWTTKHGYQFQHEPDPIADPEPNTTAETRWPTAA